MPKVKIPARGKKKAKVVTKPYSKKGKMAAKKLAQKTGGQMMMGPGY